MSDIGALLAFARGEGEEPVGLVHPEVEMERQKKEREERTKAQNEPVTKAEQPHREPPKAEPKPAPAPSASERK